MFAFSDRFLGGLIPVPDSSDVFKNSILAPLQSAYLYDESRQFFRYKSAVLVKNPTLERKVSLKSSDPTTWHLIHAYAVVCLPQPQL